MVKGIEEVSIEVKCGHKSFKNGLSCKFGKFSIITGLNGSGKTQLLECINNKYTQANNKGSVFFKTTAKNSYGYKKRITYPYRNYNESDDYSLSTNSIWEDINLEYEKFINKKRFTGLGYPSVLENLLFNQNNMFNKDYKLDFIEILISKLSDLTGENIEIIKKKFGYPLKEDILRIIGNNIQKNNNFSSKRSNDFKNKLKNSACDESGGLDFKKEDVKNAIKEAYGSKFCTNCITSQKKLIDYIEELSNPLKTIDGIILKLSNIIYDDAVAKAKTRGDEQVWKNINKVLNKDKYKDNFKYILLEPDVRIDYKLSFGYKDKTVSDDIIFFEGLSSGEKIIFELICYEFIINNASKNRETNLILLDEFDANLNPALSELFIKTVRDELVDKGIKVILTTHSPSTVAFAEPNELYWMENINDSHNIRPIKNEDGKKEILEKLAPNFVYYGALGIFGILAKSQEDNIILVEGPSDEIHFNTAAKHLNINNCKFINCDGATKMIPFITTLKTIPLFKQILNTKKIFIICDYDTEGLKTLSTILNNKYAGHCNNAVNEQFEKAIETCIKNKTENCIPVQIEGLKNFYVLPLWPNKDDIFEIWKYRNYDIEHLYNLEKLDCIHKGQVLMQKMTKDNIESILSTIITEEKYNVITFEKEHYFYKTKDDSKMIFAKYVSEHPEDFKEVFEKSFKKMFDIIDNCKAQ